MMLASTRCISRRTNCYSCCQYVVFFLLCLRISWGSSYCFIAREVVSLSTFQNTKSRNAAANQAVMMMARKRKSKTQIRYQQHKLLQYRKRWQSDLVISTAHEMKGKGFAWDLATFSAVLEAYGRKQDWSNVEDTISEVNRRRAHLCPDSSYYSTAILACVACRKVEHILKLLQEVAALKLPLSDKTLRIATLELAIARHQSAVGGEVASGGDGNDGSRGGGGGRGKVGLPSTLVGSAAPSQEEVAWALRDCARKGEAERAEAIVQAAQYFGINAGDDVSSIITQALMKANTTAALQSMISPIDTEQISSGGSTSVFCPQLYYNGVIMTFCKENNLKSAMESFKLSRIPADPRTPFSAEITGATYISLEASTYVELLTLSLKKEAWDAVDVLLGDLHYLYCSHSRGSELYSFLFEPKDAHQRFRPQERFVSGIIAAAFDRALKFNNERVAQLQEGSSSKNSNEVISCFLDYFNGRDSQFSADSRDCLPFAKDLCSDFDMKGKCASLDFSFAANLMRLKPETKKVISGPQKGSNLLSNHVSGQQRSVSVNYSPSRFRFPPHVTQLQNPMSSNSSSEQKIVVSSSSAKTLDFLLPQYSSHFRLSVYNSILTALANNTKLAASPSF